MRKKSRPALPHADHRGFASNSSIARGGVVVEAVGVVGMHARRGEHTLQLAGDLDRSLARFRVDPDADEPVDAGGPRSLDHVCRFAVHQEQVAVGVHRSGLHRHFRVRPLIEARAYTGLHLGSNRGSFT